jgi:hypothetical protein
MKRIFIVIIFALLLYSNHKALASSVYMESVKELNIEESFIVKVFLDSDETPVNSVDITIEYNPELVDFKGFKDNDTLVKTWIKSPSQIEGNKINMTGIIPGGVSGVYDSNDKDLKDIPIVNLMFKAKKEGTLNLSFEKSDILKNDGLGTTLSVSSNPLEINIKNEDLREKVSVPDIYLVNELEKDANPPLPFQILFLASNSDESNPEDLIIFNTTDLEGGIKEYRIKKGENWEIVNSPQVISKKIFSQKITIRAYDFSDNFTESAIDIEGRISYRLIIFLLLLLFVSGFLARKLLK